MKESAEQSRPYLLRLIQKTVGIEAYRWGFQKYLDKISTNSQKPSTIIARLAGLGCGVPSFILPANWELIQEGREPHGDMEAMFDIVPNISMVIGGFMAGNLAENPLIGVGTYLASRTFINAARYAIFDRFSIYRF